MPRFALRLALASCIVLLVIGCVQQDPANTGGTGGTGTAAPTLSADQQNDVQAGLAAAEGLAAATTAVQSATGTDQSQSALTIPSAGSTTFGTCPEVTLTTSSATAITASMTVDFGTGCNPLGSTSYTCAGTASGSISALDQSLDATFNNFTCNNRSLSGTLDLAWGRGGDEVDLSGEWDVTFTDIQGTDWTTDGEGTVAYHRDDGVFELGSFNGAVSDGTDTWSATASGVKSSYVQNGNYIPYEGTITLTGAGGTTVEIMFDSDSPSTGMVVVTVNNQAIPFDLDDL